MDPGDHQTIEDILRRILGNIPFIQSTQQGGAIQVFTSGIIAPKVITGGIIAVTWAGATKNANDVIVAHGMPGVPTFIIPFTFTSGADIGIVATSRIHNVDNTHFTLSTYSTDAGPAAGASTNIGWIGLML